MKINEYTLIKRCNARTVKPYAMIGVRPCSRSAENRRKDADEIQIPTGTVKRIRP